MPKQGKYKKDTTQPSVALMLNLNPSAKSVKVTEANNSDCEQKTQKPKDTKKKRTKKRWWETGDSDSYFPQNSANIIRNEKKKAKTMDTNSTQGTSDNTLSVEMQQMEKRITESITNHNRDSMKTSYKRQWRKCWDQYRKALRTC